MLAYNRANRMVAILCNHQRSVPKGHETQVEKLDGEIETIAEDIKKAKQELKDVVRAVMAILLFSFNAG